MTVSNVRAKIKHLKSQANKQYKYEEWTRLQRTMDECSRLANLVVVGAAYWIPLKDKMFNYECSNCHSFVNNKTKFCPCCGFKMEEYKN